MLLMVLHNLVPHVHHSQNDHVHEVVHVEHNHHGHSHHHHNHDEEDNDQDSDKENGHFFSLLFGNHGHTHISHEHIQLICTEKQSASVDKSFFDGNFKAFTLKPQLVYDIGSPSPKRGASRCHNPFLLNCSLRAPPSFV